MIANEAGFSISAEDLTQAQSELWRKTELSESELEGVAGGFVNWIATMTDDVHN